MTWIEKTLAEYDEVLGRSRPENVSERMHEFLRVKLLESYRNGAQAERRRRLTQDPSGEKMKSYAKGKRADQ